MSDETQQEQRDELSELDLAQLSARERKRYQARIRKRRQRAHERAGIPSDPQKKLETAWQANRAAIMADPEQSVSVRERLFEFQFIRRQMSAVIDRIRRGVHPDVEGAGRFYDCVAEDVLAHVQKYGLVEFFPSEILHLPKPSAIEQMNADPRFHYRINFGWNIDGLSNLEYDEFFESFFEWYLTNRDNPHYDYEWAIADGVHESFGIPEKFLTGIFARPRTVWVRLHRRRTDASHF